MPVTRQLTWFSAGDRLETQEITAAETRLGIRFPADYRSVVIEHSGASNPDESVFSVVDRGRRRNSCFGTMLSLRDTHEQNVFETIENLADQLPARVIPIVDTGFGDFVCLDYRTSDSPSVVYFNHNLNVDQSILPLDDTFAELLARLTVPTDE